MATPRSAPPLTTIIWAVENVARYDNSLFPGGPERTTNPADFTSLMDDLEARVFDQLPDET